eukprot:704475-Prymnesium_polylepis.1
MGPGFTAGRGELIRTASPARSARLRPPARSAARASLPRAPHSGSCMPALGTRDDQRPRGNVW